VPTYNRIVKIGVEVSDLEAALAFYTGTLGMPVLERFPQPNGDEYVFLDAGTVILELMPPATGGGTLHHLAVEVEDTDKAVAYFKGAGIPVTMEHTVVENTIHLADIRDPDHLRVPLFRRDA
jgi:catechol 2,3-dioxygenase-like lactoylglutathione lyase family enzyme